jgi:hypothetical protein
MNSRFYSFRQKGWEYRVVGPVIALSRKGLADSARAGY